MARRPHTLMAKAVAVLLGIGAVTGGVLTVAFVFKQDLGQQRAELRALGEREADLQRRLVLAVDLLADLSLGRPDPSDAATLRQWGVSLAKLADAGGSSADAAQATLDPVAIRALLVDLEEIRRGGAPEGRLQEFVSRLVPLLRSHTEELQSALGEARQLRARRARGFERDADAAVLWMLMIGLSGFVVVCLLAGRFLLRLRRDLRRLARHARRVASGDLAGPLDLRRGDEVDELAEAIEGMPGVLAGGEMRLRDDSPRTAQAQKLSALGTFAAGIAHEIANPIHAIRAVCRQMITRLSDEQDERGPAHDVKALEMILEQGERIERAVQDLRELALPARDRMEPTSINVTLEHALGLLRYDRRFRRIEVIADLSPEVPVVHGAPDQLTQVAISALTSAAEAVGNDGKITVTSRPEGSGVLVTFQDNAGGMSGDASRGAPSPSFTAGSRRKEDGLASCRAIVEQHRGTLEIESLPGRGTTVSIRIPAMLEAGHP